MDTKLECPHCHYTLSIMDWNKSITESMLLGICEELIPHDLPAEEWEQYVMEHGGRCDCPECGEVAIFDDMNAY